MMPSQIITPTTCPICDEQIKDCRQEASCKEGNHKFVDCDDWEPTCIHCGQFA